jgi:hypothetical protein
VLRIGGATPISSEQDFAAALQCGSARVRCGFHCAQQLLIGEHCGHETRRFNDLGSYVLLLGHGSLAL